MSEKVSKESQYMVSHPELDSDPPIGSDRESGRDTRVLTDSLTQKPKPMCEQPLFSMAYNDHFYFFHIYIPNHFHKNALLFWVVDFWCCIASSTNPDTFTAFHR